MARKKFVISAEVHSDDFRAGAKFDAEEWFKTASEEKIRELAFCDWGGDYAADEVAQSFAATQPQVKHMFDYLAVSPAMPNGDTVGFECHVNMKDVAAWLKVNRPELYTTFVNEGVFS